MPELITIYWRDIPAQVIAKQGRTSHKVQLSPRFQSAIDRAAGTAGKEDADDYLSEWRRESRQCDGDIFAAAEAEAERLQGAYPRTVLDRLVAAGGVDETGDQK